MKTTLEIPDALFRQAKSAAAEQGIPLRALVSEALAEKLRVRGEAGRLVEGCCAGAAKARMMLGCSSAVD
jgi:hypothetical protein